MSYAVTAANDFPRFASVRLSTLREAYQHSSPPDTRSPLQKHAPPPAISSTRYIPSPPTTTQDVKFRYVVNFRTSVDLLALSIALLSLGDFELSYEACNTILTKNNIPT